LPHEQGCNVIQEFYEKLWSVIRSSKKLFYIYYDDRQSYASLYNNIEILNGLLENRLQQKIIVYTEKSFESYCALYAILLSKNIWIPVSPDYPENRTIKAFELCQPDVIFTDRPLSKKLAIFADKNKCKVFDLQTALKETNPKRLILGEFEPNEIAYIMFTSGSTGVPKGVPMTHLNYINFVKNSMSILPFKKHEVFSDYHDLGFDISIFYLFCVILVEGALSPFLRAEEKFIPVDHIVKNGITVWSSVPSVILNITRLRPKDLVETSLRIAFLCGEPLRLDVLKYCYDNMAIEHVYNFYGLTETGVENFYYACEPEDVEKFKNKGFLPIGSPLAGNQVRVSKKKELLISGCQVTPGYLGATDKDRFSQSGDVVWYHTGDIVEVDDGLYFCKGRLDSQVKIGGFRIELMDIEVCVRNFPGVTDAVCFLDQWRQRTLLTCVIEKRGNEPVDLINKYLKNELPTYMVPSKFVVVESFPRNANGKVDRPEIYNLVKRNFINDESSSMSSG
jgi:D-alanine--poly(phosphoribitol) ligase subunit 1